jgi:hypothetical protein
VWNRIPICRSYSRWSLRFAGLVDPYDIALFDVRLSFRSQCRDLQRLVDLVIAWAPERIVLSHRRFYQTNAVGDLERAFGWVRPAAMPAAEAVS